MYAFDLDSLSLQAPQRTAALQPFWWNAPLPGWGGNPEEAGPELVGVGSACGMGADCPPPELNFGHVALGASAGLLVGLLIGWVSQRERGLRRNSRPGSGARFRALSHKLGHRRGRYHVRDPKALAAAIGRKKYGKKRFQAMAAAGRRRRHHHARAA